MNSPRWREANWRKVEPVVPRAAGVSTLLATDTSHSPNIQQLDAEKPSWASAASAARNSATAVIHRTALTKGILVAGLLTWACGDAIVMHLWSAKRSNTWKLHIIGLDMFGTTWCKVGCFTAPVRVMTVRWVLRWVIRISACLFAICIAISANFNASISFHHLEV